MKAKRISAKRLVMKELRNTCMLDLVSSVCRMRPTSTARESTPIKSWTMIRDTFSLLTVKLYRSCF